MVSKCSIPSCCALVHRLFFQRCDTHCNALGFPHRFACRTPRSTKLGQQNVEARWPDEHCEALNVFPEGRGQTQAWLLPLHQHWDLIWRWIKGRLASWISLPALTVSSGPRRTQNQKPPKGTGGEYLEIKRFPQGPLLTVCSIAFSPIPSLNIS